MIINSENLINNLDCLAKKRLMDSIVTPLTSQGSHFALDVRQGLRFLRSGTQQQSSGHSGNSGNHGLVVQVEDQDGRPLKPSLYIQEPNCQLDATGVITQVDDKACECVTLTILILFNRLFLCLELSYFYSSKDSLKIKKLFLLNIKFMPDSLFETHLKFTNVSL